MAQVTRQPLWWWRERRDRSPQRGGWRGWEEDAAPEAQDEVFTGAEIAAGVLPDNTPQEINVAIAKAVESGVAKSRVAAPAAIRMSGAMPRSGCYYSTSLSLCLGVLP